MGGFRRHRLAHTHIAPAQPGAGQSRVLPLPPRLVALDAARLPGSFPAPHFSIRLLFECRSRRSFPAPHSSVRLLFECHSRRLFPAPHTPALLPVRSCVAAAVPGSHRSNPDPKPWPQTRTLLTLLCMVLSGSLRCRAIVMLSYQAAVNTGRVAALRACRCPCCPANESCPAN